MPAQWAVQTALGGYQSIKELLAPGGRLFESRRAILEATASSRFLELAPPKGSMYAFVRVKTEELPDFDDQTFALDLLEQKHVLLAPGTSFNVPVPRSFPHHAAARRRVAQEGVRAHRRIADVVRRPPAGDEHARRARGVALQVACL